MIIPSSFFYQLMSSAFCIIVLVSNIISVKFIQIPYLSNSVPVGLLSYPFTFLLAQLITEFYGVKKAQETIYITWIMNLLGYVLIQFALILPSNNPSQEMAFQTLLGLSGLRIFASLSGYMVAQTLNVWLYVRFSSFTALHLSLFIDTCLVDILYLYGGIGMALEEIFSIIVLSYLYKAFFSLAIMPLFYLSRTFLLKQKKS